MCFEFVRNFCTIGLHTKYPLFWSDFNETWIFFDRFSKNTPVSYFMRIRPAGAEFHADGRKDMTKLVAAFCSFVNAKKNTRTIFQMAVVTTCTIWCYIFELFVLPRDGPWLWSSQQTSLTDWSFNRGYACSLWGRHRVLINDLVVFHCSVSWGICRNSVIVMY